MTQPAVVSLEDKSGNFVRLWAEAGYYCVCYDVQHSIRRDRPGRGWGLQRQLLEACEKESGVKVAKWSPDDEPLTESDDGD